ncbi:MAG: glycosyltransferase family 2 protein [Cyanobacteriota bacterium]
MEQKIALVSTFNNSTKEIESFIEYHIHIGFSNLFLFFDDPNDLGIKIASKYKNVTVIKRDSDLEKKWKETSFYEREKKVLAIEPLSRELLNISVAIKMAKKINIDWIINLNMNELFYLKNKNLQDHFKELNDMKIDSVRYSNFEALPEKFDIDDKFKEVKLFKKNHTFVGNKKLLNDKNHFINYIHGRCSAKISNDLEPVGLHSYNKTHFYCEGYPIILNYYCCGYEAFLKNFYDIGLFNPKWITNDAINKKFPFYKQARDIIFEGNEEKIKQFYKEKVMMFSDDVKKYLLSDNLLCEINEPSEILKSKNK